MRLFLVVSFVCLDFVSASTPLPRVGLDALFPVGSSQPALAMPGAYGNSSSGVFPGGAVRPISAQQVQATMAMLGEIFAPGSQTAICPLTATQIEEALGIIDNTMGYLQGTMRALSTTRKDAILAEARARRLTQGTEDLVSDDNKIEFLKLMYLCFQDNLLYLSNTIRNLLNDDHQKDAAYRQLIREIASVNHWFDSITIPQRLALEPMITLQTIFKGLGMYFPSTNSRFGNMFALANGVTTIDRIDAVHARSVERFEAMEARARAQLQSAGKKRNQKKQEIVRKLNIAIEQIIMDPVREIELCDLVDPYNQRRRKYGLNWRDRYLKRHQVVLDLKMTPDSDSGDEGASANADNHDVEQLSGAKAGVTVATSEVSSLKKEAVVDDNEEDAASTQVRAIQIAHSSKAMKAIAGAASVAGGAAAAAAAITDNSDDEIVDPKVLHVRYMARKNAIAAAASDSRGLLDSAHSYAQKFYKFLHDCVYGRRTFTWKDFSREFKRVGFSIQGMGNGNARQIVLGRQKFTVHKPNNETDFVPYDYIHHIRSGLEHVFGITSVYVRNMLQETE